LGKTQILEDDIINYKAEIQKLKAENLNLKALINNNQTFDSNLKAGIYKIFNDLVAHSNYQSANVKILIVKFKKEFSFLSQ